MLPIRDRNLELAIERSLNDQPSPVSPVFPKAAEKKIKKLTHAKFCTSRDCVRDVGPPAITAAAILAIPAVCIAAEQRGGLITKLGIVAKATVEVCVPLLTKGAYTGGIAGFGIATAITAISFYTYKFIVWKTYQDAFEKWKKVNLEKILEDIAIPEHLHEDEFLSKHVCPITQCPIRCPVRDKYGQLWEEAAIKSWLKKHSTCPLTRRALTIADLSFEANLYRQIEHRLELLGFEDI